MTTTPPQVQVVDHPDHAVPLLLEAVGAVASEQPRPLIGFATGSTFAPFFGALDAALRDGTLPTFVATHLDEYVGCTPETPGGMVHELFSVCPEFRRLKERGAFIPVPGVEDGSAIRRHESRLAEAAPEGIALQLLGLGRNGHIAFNEPGTPFELGFHTVELAESTRDDARARFSPLDPPRRAVTAGPASILDARQIILCAFGATKADAVRAMLHGSITPACPASVLRRHSDVR
ncbi:MAG: 6-phosphogluconolactonase, partial [Planctomycetes bacterium]|nr:6-phosphogluconolactonase [Planctomycetota bacterium]